MLEIIAKFSGIFLVFKVVSHLIIEKIRKDNKETTYTRGGGIGGVFLFPIPKGDNRYLNCWIFIANFLFYVSIAIVLILKCL